MRGFLFILLARLYVGGLTFVIGYSLSMVIHVWYGRAMPFTGSTIAIILVFAFACFSAGYMARFLATKTITIRKV